MNITTKIAGFVAALLLAGIGASLIAFSAAPNPVDANPDSEKKHRRKTDSIP